MAKQYNVSVLVELFDKLSAPLTRINKKMVEAGKKWADTGKKLSIGVSLPIIGLGVAAVKTSADIEKYTESFTTMLKSADAGKKFVSGLRDFAAKTPLEFADLAKNAELMLAFNIQSKDVLPTMQMLGDVARGDAEKLSQLSLAYSQMHSTGRLMGQDLLQMINGGFNPLVVIAEKTGKSMTQLKDEMSKGMISVDMVTDAFKSATSAGGLFYKSMDTQSKTFYGRLSTLKDNFTLFLSKLGDALFPLVNSMLDGLAQLVDWFNTLGESTSQLIVMFGGLAAAIGPVMFIAGKLMATFAGGITPIHLIIGGLALIATGAMAVSEAIDKSNRKFEIAADNAKKEADEVQSLVSEYEGLKNKTNLNTKEKIRLIDVENRLRILLPQSAIEFDKQAKMIGINTDAVKKHLNELKELEKINLKKQIQKTQSEYDALEKSISNAENEMIKFQEMHKKGKAPGISYGLDTELTRQQFRNRLEKDMENQRVKIGEQRKKLIILYEKLQNDKAKLDEAENKNTKKQNDELKEQNKLLSKGLSFRERLLMLQRKFAESGGYAVRHNRGMAESIAALNQQAATKSKAEVTIKVKADQGTSATIQKIDKQVGDVDLNIISDSYLGYTVPVGAN